VFDVSLNLTTCYTETGVMDFGLICAVFEMNVEVCDGEV